MCGIAALLDPNGVPAERLQAFNDAVRHRGPDGEGFVFFQGSSLQPVIRGGPDTPAAAYSAALPYSPQQGAVSDATVALAHRRLAILDLGVTGHQPMCYAQARYWITYNGEIYNYLELRDALRSRGHVFISGTDTEVLLAAYAEWGPACLDQLQGMFAFVLIDRERRSLFAARDRFGIKPLYYHVTASGALAFASEIKQFTTLPGWQAGLNRQRAYDFLAWNTHDHTAETLFRDVYQLRGGESLAMTFEDAFAACRRSGIPLPAARWYSLSSRLRSTAPATAAGAAELKSRLEHTIDLHLRSDVPVGSCLSGGLDSSTIVCLANRALRTAGAAGNQQTFSATTAVAALDERKFMNEVVAHTGVQARYIEPTAANLFDNLDRITRHQDEPFGSTSIFAQWSVFGLAAEHGVKVMLDGQGADELFAGYHTYFGALFARLLRTARLIALYRECTAAQINHHRNWMWSAQQCANFLLPEILRQPLRRRAGRTTARPPWLDLDRLGVEPHDPHLATGASKARSVRELSIAQLVTSSVPALLRYEDRNSMAHSVEARVPFLDHRFVEFVLGLPDEQKISNGVTKRILRESMLGILPENVRQRMDKLGFVTPEEVWMRSTSPALFRNAMTAAVDAAGGILTTQAGLLQSGIADSTRHFDHAAWRAISFGHWAAIHSVRI